MNKNTILINGKTYNASASGQNNDLNRHKNFNGNVVDGIKPTPRQTNKIMSSTVSKTPNHLKRNTQKSQTLIRSRGLKKIKEQHGSWLTASSQPVISTTIIKTKADQTRIKRASEISKSKFINKFAFNGHVFTKKAAHLPIVKEDSAHAVSSNKIAPRTALPQDRFHHAIAAAKSHEQKFVEPTKKHSKNKLFKRGSKAKNVGTAVVSALLIVGFYAYQNIPNFSYKIAASKAGINGTLPGYRPAGFAMGNIESTPGQVTISFKSNTDSRTFKISQTNSNWDSEALKANFLTAHQYLTAEEKGRTIFIYDNSSATWIDGGIWYNIEGNSRLTSDQLLRMARSM